MSEKMLLQIDEVVPRKTNAMTTGETVWCALNSDDYRDANDAIKRVLQEERYEEE